MKVNEFTHEKALDLKKIKIYLVVMTDKTKNDPNETEDPEMSVELEVIPGAAPGKILSPAAKRALEEAALRREAEKLADANKTLIQEWNGPAGEEPTRFGDWERKGIAYDF